MEREFGLSLGASQGKQAIRTVLVSLGRFGIFGIGCGDPQKPKPTFSIRRRVIPCPRIQNWQRLVDSFQTGSGDARAYSGPSGLVARSDGSRPDHDHMFGSMNVQV